jgi:flagellar hook-associated protein 2
LGALQTIVDGYNKLLSSIQNEIKYDSDIAKRGGLANNSVAKNFISNLRQLTTKAFPDGNGGTFTLADIGVKTNVADGTLKIDTGLVSQVQQSKPELFVAVITSKSATQSNGDAWSGPTGALDQMIALNKIVIGTGSDFSKLLTKTQNVDEQAISDDQVKLDDDMIALKNRYLTQFTAMQNILNATKSDQTSLTNMMSSWSAGLKG